MIVNRYSLSQAPVNLRKAVLVCNPKELSELFKIAEVSVKTQLFIENAGVSAVCLQIPAKKLRYHGEQVVSEGYLFVRLPHSAEEKEYFDNLAEAEVWEVSGEDEGILRVSGSHLLEIKEHAANKRAEALWRTLPEQEKRWGVNKLPLFRSNFLSIFWKSKKEALELLFERLRMRYEENRTMEKIGPGIVVTPNLDHLRMLFEDNNEAFQQVYANAILQTPDGYPPLVKFAKQSIGYQTQEQITGVDMFMQLINTIGRESLPYTIYLVGGFGNVPYQARDFFVSIYPNLASNFVGISTPPIGFLKNEQIMTAIVEDINKKKPDLIFAGMTAPVQELFIQELINRKVNFGLGFGVGRAIEILTGFQKKEPAVFEKLHVSWIYRAFTGSSKDIVRRNFDRVKKDLLFAFRRLTK